MMCRKHVWIVLSLGIILLAGCSRASPVVLQLPTAMVVAADVVKSTATVENLPPSQTAPVVFIPIDTSTPLLTTPTSTQAVIPLPNPTETSLPMPMLSTPTQIPALPTLTPEPPTVTAEPVFQQGLENLDGFLWENRLIVVFAASAELPTIQNQLLAENAAVVDRHILWFIVTEDVVTTNYTGQLSSLIANNLRQRYARLDTTLETVLIGKDGGVKNRQPFLDSSAIYGQIDTMPMRQRELQEQDR